MVKASTPTVRLRGSNRRASADPRLSFGRLEKFANLDSHLSAFEAFALEHPTFAPVQFYDAALSEKAQNHPVGWRPDFYGLFRIFRDLLRDVWERGSNPELAVLLGIDARAWQIISRQTKAGFLDSVFGGYEASLQKEMPAISENYFAVPSRVYPDWKSGSFRYEADTDFRRAVYELFRQSWRAKVCPDCCKYFIADKPPQRYCSSKCYGAAKLHRDREFWRRKGTVRRREREQKERRS